MSIKWDELDSETFENMVSVLLSRLHTDARRIDGKGGDGGRDVQIVDKQDIRIRLAFELKSFTGRVDRRRRKQVERSLKRAATLEPTEWALVVPIDHSPSEERWFNEIGSNYPFPIDWFGKTWLDEKMAMFPDIRRYFLEGAKDEVYSLLWELREEQARITSVHDAVARVRPLRGRLNEIDPYYRYEISTGRSVSESRPMDVAMSVSFDDVRVDVYPKYLGAIEDRPIIITVEFLLERDDEVVEHALDFGLDVTIPAESVNRVTIDAPSGLGGTFTGGKLDLWSTSTSLDNPITLTLDVVKDEKILASCPIHLTQQRSGRKGFILTGTDNSGWMETHLTVNTIANRFEAEFRFNPKPALPSILVPLYRWLGECRAPHDLKIRWPGGLEMRSTIRTPSFVDENFTTVVEALYFLQDNSKVYGEMPLSLTREDKREIVEAATLVKGQSINSTWKSFSLGLSHWGPELDGLLDGRGQQFICEADEWIILEGLNIPVGRIRTHVQSARLADPEAVRESLMSGLVPSLRMIPGDTDVAQRVLATRI